MNQTSFIVEIVINDNGTPTIIIREPQRGQVVKITNKPADVELFLCDLIQKATETKSVSNSAN